MECLKRQGRAVRYILGADCWCWGIEKSQAIGQTITVSLMVVSVLALLIPQFQTLSDDLPCCSGWDGCGTIVILRFTIVFILFLVLFGILELMKCFKNPTAAWLWVIKALMVISGCWGSLYIPAPDFDRIWTEFLLFGAMTFIVMQVYVFIRLSYVVVIKLNRMVENGSQWIGRLEILLFALGVITPILGEILMIYYYPLCSLNLIFLLTNAAIPFIACLWSMSDCVRSMNGYSGFVQGGIFACFIIFYTWSALASNPNQSCNPYFESKSIIIFMQCWCIISAFVTYVLSVFFSYNIYVEETEESILSSTDGSDSNVERKEVKKSVREVIIHTYLPGLDGFLSASMVCYIAMSLLNWTSSEVSGNIMKESKTAMWFKVIGCWLSVLFFVITLYTPRLYGIFPRKSLFT